MPNLFFPNRVAAGLLFALLPVLAFSQTDTVPPQLLCKDAFDINMPLCGNYGFMLHPYELLENYSDNATPAAQLDLRARRACSGSGFPEIPLPTQFQPLSFSYNDLYHSFPLEIWARDLAGNISMCTTSIFFFDGFGNCDPGMSIWVSFAGTNNAVSGVAIDIRGHRCPGDTLIIEGLTPWPPFGQTIPSGYQTTVTPTKNINPLNGITIHDLFLINQHILGITPLTNPFQLIAADVDQDGQITQQDRLILRKLMNGTLTELPNGRSWRFVQAEFVFDLLQPFVFPEKVEVSGTNPIAPSSFVFTGVKIGDVDFSADPAQ